MNALEVVFWLSVAVLGYAYAGYPLALLIAAKLRPRPVSPTGVVPQSCSVVIAAYNEQTSLDRRLRELTEHLADSGINGEIIVVSDGSTDHTAAVGRAWEQRNVRVIELEQNGGKAAALNVGCAAATGEIIVFADTRQRFDHDTLSRLLCNFADPEVGAVSGQLLIESAPGVLDGVGLYWRYEKFIRRLESLTGSVCGVSGSIAAVRRELYRPLPRGIILDDVYWPVQVAMQRRRVVFEPGARAYDRLPDSPRDEFRRKVRTLCGNFQLLSRLPAVVLPWRNPLWWRVLSHKVARLVVPWAMLAMLCASALLPGTFYTTVLLIQVGAYGLALAAVQSPTLSRFRLASAAASFVVLNTAAFVAFWMWSAGRAGTAWRKASYKSAPAARADTATT